MVCEITDILSPCSTSPLVSVEVLLWSHVSPTFRMSPEGPISARRTPSIDLYRALCNFSFVVDHATYHGGLDIPYIYRQLPFGPAPPTETLPNPDVCS